MASFGGGIKRPLNMLENPIQVNYRKAPPRFKSAGKYWKADSSVLRDTEHMNQFYEDAILAQPYDYNKTVYGQDALRITVNEEFRPPLLDPIEQVFPLNKIPVQSQSNIHPRINPGSAGHMGTSGYTARNQTPQDPSSYLDPNGMEIGLDSGYVFHVERPLDNSVLPDLELTVPNFSATSGLNLPSLVMPGPNFLMARGLETEKDYFLPSQDSGYNPQVTFDARNPSQDLQLNETIPSVSATSGYNPSIRKDSYHPSHYSDKADFHTKVPLVSVSAGQNTQVTLDSTNPLSWLSLERKTAPYSTDSGKNPVFTVNQELYTQVLPDLQNTIPNFSASSGTNNPVLIDAPRREHKIETFGKLMTDIPHTIINPGSGDGYKKSFIEDPNMSSNTDKYISQSTPNYSYSVVPQYAYKERNSDTYKPQVTPKLQPLKHYGKITSASSMPKTLYSDSKLSLSQLRKNNSMAGKPKKSTYRL